MQATVLATIIAVLFSQYASENWAPGFVKLTPEVLSIVVTMYVVLAGMRLRFKDIQAKYWIIFGALALDIICGLAANKVGSGPIIAGMRSYIRAIPFFFLPALYEFSEKQIKQQLALLLVLSLLQVPFAAHQRWVIMSEGRWTGDQVFGTLGTENSGTLTLFLISAVCILLGLFLRNRINKLWGIVLFFILLIPTTINETKVTVFLLPLSLLATLLIGSEPSKRLRIALLATGLIVGFGAIFIPIYNAMQENNPYPQKISLGLLTDNKSNYLEAKNAGVGATSYVGRGDAVMIPLRYVLKTPATAAFGLGMGNASTSNLGQRFWGKFGSLFEFVTLTSFAAFLLELGLIGIVLIFTVHWSIFSDALYVARHNNGLAGAIAVGWIGVTIVIVVAIFYGKPNVTVSLSYLYWYFSGLLAATFVRLMPASIGAPRALYRASAVN